MKIASVAEVKGQFSAFLKSSEGGPVVVTRNGRPVAVIVGVQDEDEIERLLMAYSPRLRTILDASRQQYRAGQVAQRRGILVQGRAGSGVQGAGQGKKEEGLTTAGPQLGSSAASTRTATRTACPISSRCIGSASSWTGAPPPWPAPKPWRKTARPTCSTTWIRRPPWTYRRPGRRGNDNTVSPGRYLRHDLGQPNRQCTATSWTPCRMGAWSPGPVGNSEFGLGTDRDFTVVPHERNDMIIEDVQLVLEHPSRQDAASSKGSM